MAFVDLFAKLGLDVEGFQKGVDEAVGKAEKLGDSMEKVGKGLTASITAPLAAVGALALKSASDFDAAFDAIRVGTGATGERMKELEDSFQTVFAGVPQDAEVVGQAIAALNARLGLSGPVLDAMATQMLNLARITKSDVEPLIAQTTRVFGDWDIATEKQSASLDFLFKVSQSTGAGIGELSQKVVQFGAPLRQMGFDFETSAALLGKFEKEGVNAELVMGSLRIALTKMAKEGITDASAGLREIQERIQGAGSASQANAIAVAAFGAKAGPDMAAAIREGRFAIGDLVEQLHSSKETINDATAATADFPEMWKRVQHQLEAALLPLGRVIFDALPKLIDALTPAVDFLRQLGEKFGELDPQVQTFVVALGALAAVIGPILVGVGALLPILAAISLPVVAGVAAVAAITAAIIAWREEIAEFLVGIGAWLAQLVRGNVVLSAVWTALKAVGAVVWDVAKAAFDALVETLKTVFGWLSKVVDFFREKGRAALEAQAQSTKKLEVALDKTAGQAKALTAETGKLTQGLTVTKGATAGLGGETDKLNKLLDKGKTAHQGVTSEVSRAKEMQAQWGRELSAFTKKWEEVRQEAERQKVAIAEAARSMDFYREAADRAVAEGARPAKEALASLNMVIDAGLEPFREGVRASEQYDDAMKALGITSRDLHNRELRDLHRAYETIRQEVQAGRRPVEDLAAAQDALGRKMKDVEGKGKDLGGSLKQISTTISDFAKTLTQAIFKAIGPSEANRKLDEDAAKLRDSLAERATSWEEYIAEVAEKITELSAKHTESLEKEQQKLRESLASREQDYEEFAASTAEKLAAFRKADAERLDEELEKLREKLADRLQAYEDHAEDANLALAKVGKNLTEKLADANRNTNRKIEDENRDFGRDLEDLNADIREAEKKGDQRRIAELRTNLHRRVEDHRNAIRRMREDLEEQTKDARNQAAEQEAEIRRSLERRRREHVEQNAEIAKEMEKAVEKHKATLAKEEADVQASLAKRQADLESYRAETARKLEEAAAQHAAEQEKEVAAVQAAMAKKRAEYDKFIADTQTKLAELEAAHTTAWDRILTAAKTAFVGLGEAIVRTMVEDVFGKITKAAADWAGKLVNDIVAPVVSKIGGMIADLVGSSTKSIADVVGNVPPFIPGAIPTGPPIPSGTAPPTSAPAPAGAPSAAGAAAGSGLAGIIGAVAGVATAISSVVGNFQMAGMNKSLDLIEKSTRFSEIHLSYILDQANKYWPWLDSIAEALWKPIQVLLGDINDTLGADISARLQELRAVFVDWIGPALDGIADSAWLIRDTLRAQRDDLRMIDESIRRLPERPLTVRIEGGTTRDQEFAAAIVRSVITELKAAGKL